MDQDHEYAVLGGFNRARVGRYIFAAAAALSTALVSALATLTALLKRFGWSQGLPSIVASVVAVGSLYLILYWIFNRYAWRLPFISNVLRVPDIAGSWRCDGQTLKADKSLQNSWSGKITIIQSWDKIRVRLHTEQSGSNSLAAALHWDDVDGYRLMYHYRNDPRIDEVELQSHHGFAELIFSTDHQSAEGEYFNGRGRMTFGTMKLKRETV